MWLADVMAHVVRYVFARGCVVGLCLLFFIYCLFYFFAVFFVSFFVAFFM